MTTTHRTEPPDTTMSAAGLTTEQLGTLHDSLRQLLEVETQRVAALEADGLPPVAARDLIEMADTISAALAKIDEGTYGLCERCRQPIPFARLEVVPYAAQCVDCQSRQGSILG